LGGTETQEYTLREHHIPFLVGSQAVKVWAEARVARTTEVAVSLANIVYDLASNFGKIIERLEEELAEESEGSRNAALVDK
jgi:hypothetical protein